MNGGIRNSFPHFSAISFLSGRNGEHIPFPIIGRNLPSFIKYNKSDHSSSFSPPEECKSSLAWPLDGGVSSVADSLINSRIFKLDSLLFNASLKSGYIAK